MNDLSDLQGRVTQLEAQVTRLYTLLLVAMGVLVLLGVAVVLLEFEAVKNV